MSKKMTYEQATQKIATRLETPEHARNTIIVGWLLLAVSLLGLIYLPSFSMLVLICVAPPSLAYVIWSIAALWYLRNKSLKGKSKEEMIRIMRRATILLAISRGAGVAFLSAICLTIGLRMLSHFVGVIDVVCGLIMVTYSLLFIVLCFMWQQMLIAIVEGNVWWVRILFGGSAAVGITASAIASGLGIFLARITPREISPLIVMLLMSFIAFVGAPGAVYYLSEAYVHLQVKRGEEKTGAT